MKNIKENFDLAWRGMVNRAEAENKPIEFMALRWYQGTLANITIAANYLYKGEYNFNPKIEEMDVRTKSIPGEATVSNQQTLWDLRKFYLQAQANSDLLAAIIERANKEVEELKKQIKEQPVR